MAMNVPVPSRPTQFSTLPPEIRNQIWQNALPDTIKPALFPYKAGCWQPCFISETDPEYDPVNFFGIYMKYDLDLLNPTEVDLPLYFVNLEARGIVQPWMREHDVKVRFVKEASQPILVRNFIPLQDAIYVSSERYHEFVCEFIERGFKPDLIGQNYSHGCQDIPNIAVHEDLFWTISKEFGDVALDWFCPKVLFILLDAHGTLSSCDKDDRQQRHWSFERRGERALIWKSDLQCFVWEDDEHICDDDLYKRIEDAATTDMIPKLASCQIRDFEIRPVLAVNI